MGATKSLMLVAGLGLQVSPCAAAETQLKISQSLPLKDPDNQCISPTFAIANGKATFKITGKCAGVTALVCTYRSAISVWQCETPFLVSAGDVWLAPFQAEPSSTYYVGACKSGNSNCQDSVQFLYSRIVGRPKGLDPQQIKPPEPCNGPDCLVPPPPPPAPPPERG